MYIKNLFIYFIFILPVQVFAQAGTWKIQGEDVGFESSGDTPWLWIIGGGIVVYGWMFLIMHVGKQHLGLGALIFFAPFIITFCFFLIDSSFIFASLHSSICCRNSNKVLGPLGGFPL